MNDTPTNPVLLRKLDQYARCFIFFFFVFSFVFFVKTNSSLSNIHSDKTYRITLLGPYTERIRSLFSLINSSSIYLFFTHSTESNSVTFKLTLLTFTQIFKSRKFLLYTNKTILTTSPKNPYFSLLFPFAFSLILLLLSSPSAKDGPATSFLSVSRLSRKQIARLVLAIPSWREWMRPVVSSTNLLWFSTNSSNTKPIASKRSSFLSTNSRSTPARPDALFPPLKEHFTFEVKHKTHVREVRREDSRTTHSRSSLVQRRHRSSSSSSLSEPLSSSDVPGWYSLELSS